MPNGMTRQRKRADFCLPTEAGTQPVSRPDLELHEIRKDRPKNLSFREQRCFSAGMHMSPKPERCPDFKELVHQSLTNGLGLSCMPDGGKDQSGTEKMPAPSMSHRHVKLAFDWQQLRELTNRHICRGYLWEEEQSCSKPGPRQQGILKSAATRSRRKQRTPATGACDPSVWGQSLASCYMSRKAVAKVHRLEISQSQ